MEDEIIKSIFTKYEPDLSSDSQFISKLERNLNSVELIKQHAKEVRSRNKKALAIASIVGFFVGILFSLALPYIGYTLSEWKMTIPEGSMLKILVDHIMIIAWIMAGCTSVFASLNTYKAVLSTPPALLR